MPEKPPQETYNATKRAADIRLILMYALLKKTTLQPEELGDLYEDLGDIDDASIRQQAQEASIVLNTLSLEHRTALLLRAQQEPFGSNPFRDD